MSIINRKGDLRLSQSLHIKVTKGIDGETMGDGHLYMAFVHPASKLVSIIKSVIIDDKDHLSKYREVDELLYSTLLIEAIGDKLSKCNDAGNDEHSNSSDESCSVLDKIKDFFGIEHKEESQGSVCKKLSVIVNVDTKIIDARMLYSGD